MTAWKQWTCQMEVWMPDCAMGMKPECSFHAQGISHACVHQSSAVRGTRGSWSKLTLL